MNRNISERAYPKTWRRSATRCDWWLADILEMKIPGIGGTEKSKTVAHRVAVAAAKKYNNSLKTNNLHKATRHEIVPGCSRRIIV